MARSYRPLRACQWARSRWYFSSPSTVPQGLQGPRDRSPHAINVALHGPPHPPQQRVEAQFASPRPADMRFWASCSNLSVHLQPLPAREALGTGHRGVLLFELRPDPAEGHPPRMDFGILLQRQKPAGGERIDRGQCMVVHVGMGHLAPPLQREHAPSRPRGSGCWKCQLVIDSSCHISGKPALTSRQPNS